MAIIKDALLIQLVFILTLVSGFAKPICAGVEKAGQVNRFSFEFLLKYRIKIDGSVIFFS